MRVRTCCKGAPLLIIALFLVGCGSSSSPRQSPAAGATARALRSVQGAAATTLRGSAGVGYDLYSATAFGPTHAPVSGSGAFDFRTGVGHESIDLPEVKKQEPGQDHVIYQPDQVYLQTRAKLPAGKLWTSAPLTGSGTVKTNFPHFISQVEGVNPTLLLSELAWGAVSAVPLGPKVIFHTRTQEFRVSVDLQRAIAAARGPGAAAYGSAMQEALTAQSGAARTTAILVWVDPAGRVGQVQNTPPGAGLGTAQITLFGFGMPVNDKAPPAAQVIDIAALAPSGERENNGGGDTDGG